eukprot:NODE_3846_length_343_cov_34.704082_g3764_i0.p1 GENE.NODE_3846_length_343_cov_34.704082_g3764_i0~~NODE_3846_length_343_cov_34.704082_g3764_i0.p1  ORF type:complete len:76 (+),score=23.51 NODE_3846_length_343_cov_34.704082_g3764_i0:27-230(+)
MGVPNENKLGRADLYKLLREARLEFPYTGVDFKTYTLRSGRIPRAFFKEGEFPNAHLTRQPKYRSYA